MFLKSFSHIVCKVQKDWKKIKKGKIGDGPLNGGATTS